MGLDGFILEVMLIKESSIHGTQKETASCVDGSSDAVFGADGGDCGDCCILFELFDAGDMYLQVLQGSCDVRGHLVFLLDVYNEAFLVNEFGWITLPLLHLTLLHLFYLLQVAKACHFRLRQEPLQIILKLLHLCLYFSKQLTCSQPQLPQGLETGLSYLIVREWQPADEVLVVILEGGADGCGEMGLCSGAGEAADVVAVHDEEAVVRLLHLAARTGDRLQVQSLLRQHPLHYDYFSHPTPHPITIPSPPLRLRLKRSLTLIIIMYTKNFKVNLIDEPPLTQQQKTYLMTTVPRIARTTPTPEDFQVELSKDLCREFKKSMGVSAVVKAEDYNPDKEERHLKPCSFRFTINEFLFRVWVHQPEVQFESSIRQQ